MHATPSTTSPLGRLRAVIPTRDDVTFDEALRIAELQARLLCDLLPTVDGIQERDLTRLPRLTVTYESLQVSGMSHWNGREWVITIAKEDSLVRQRFTLLHEFKHIIDHGSAGRLYRDDRRRTAAEAAEQAADYFAGCVLVPRRELKAAWGSGLQRIEDLAAHFNASEDAVVVRLAQTGLSRETDLRVRRSRCARPIRTPANQPQRFAAPRTTRRRYS